ncbi:TonB-dependent receptor [bacterium]|nr:TonB-dependent receptor [bacterium]
MRAYNPTAGAVYERRGIIMKNASRWIVTVLVLFTWACVSMGATTGKIAGRVTDRGSGEPLPSVNVVIEGTTLGATTDLDGNYFILNIPPGVYTVKATMLGCCDYFVQNVRVQTDLTSRINIQMEPDILDVGEEVVVIAKKPLIEKDVTASRLTTSAQALELMPVDDMEDILALTAGAVEEDGQLHIRGGRNREVAFLIDGALTVDPETGSFDSDVPEMALQEVSVQTGGFGAEYGSAQSGIVNMILKEGGPKFTGALRFKTSDFSGYAEDWHEKLWNVEGSFGGPVPYIDNMRFFTSAEWSHDYGRFPNDENEPRTFQGKLTYNVTPKVKLAFNGLYHRNDYTQFQRSMTTTYNLYRIPTIEDQNEDFLDEPAFASWYGNGQLDSEWEDLNGDGIQQANEWTDLDGDGVMDTEDLNHNGQLDEHDLFDGTPEYDATSDQFGFTLTHTLSEKTFYEVRLNRYRTYLKWNIIETTNEDQDGDGRFDMGERVYSDDGLTWAWNDVNGDGIMQISEDLNSNGQFDFETRYDEFGFEIPGWDAGLDGITYPGQPELWDYGENDQQVTTEDLDGDGRFDSDPEDLNGNALWDFIYYGPDHDLYTDENHNGFVDASEIGPMDDWIPMTELPMFGVGEKNDDGFFKYGVGNTYNRDRWHEDEKFTYNAQFHMTSQVNQNHQMKWGVEGSYFDIQIYDVDAASGGNIYGEDYTIRPHSMAAYVQDKMEFEGLIVNAGIRFDYFNANYENYPSDVTDPVLDLTTGGEIKNPTSVDAKYDWSPRLGISHPITDRDVLYFNYGRYFQVPRFDYLFTNLTFQLTGAFPIIGNANLQPEQTTSYELGVKHQFANDLVLNVTGFFKDITGLTNNRQIYYSASNWYGFYDNTDYGNVRGFEVTLIKPRSHLISGTATYTYSFARGKNSSPTADYSTVWAGNNIPTTETYLDWDQRHTLSSNVDFRTLDGERFFGVPYTENLGFNFIVAYGSGMPWSPPAKDQDSWKYENTERMPWTMSVDMIADKGFRFDRYYAKVFVEVRNLFNRLNIIDLDDEEWYALQVDSNGNRIYDPDGAYNDPSVYGSRRIIRVGAKVEF